MKKFTVKNLLIFFFPFVLFNSCINDKENKRKPIKNEQSGVETNTFKKNSDTSLKADTLGDNDEELIENEELIEKAHFERWQGKYYFSFKYTDNIGKVSDLKAVVTITKPDNCIFESWYEDVDDKTRRKNEYLKLVGSLYSADQNNFKIIFLENKVLKGISPNLDPVFTLLYKNNKYFIESLLTSPPHNGIIKIPIEKR